MTQAKIASAATSTQIAIAISATIVVRDNPPEARDRDPAAAFVAGVVDDPAVDPEPAAPAADVRPPDAAPAAPAGPVGAVEPVLAASVPG